MSKTKKIISVVLAAALVMAMATVAMVSASAATTVYFENSEGWGEVCAYVWGGANGEELGTWPGSPCTNVEGNVWSIDIPDDCTNVIFNNNNNGAQTNNLVNPGSAMIAKLGEGTELNEYGQPMTVYAWETYENAPVETTTAAPTTTAAATTVAPTTTAPATTVEPTEAPTTAAPTTVAPTTAASEDEPVETTVAPTTGTVEPTEVPTTVAPTTVAPTTVAPTTVAPEKADVIVVDGTEYTAKVGDEVVYTATLKTPALIEDVQGYVTYDATKLTVVECNVPQLGDSAIVNTEEAGIVYFNASVVKGIDFTAEATLVEIKFTVADTAYSEIALTIEEMTEKDGDSYFTDSEQKNDAVVVTETLAVPQETTPAATTATPAATTATPAATTATPAATTADKGTDAQGTTGGNAEDPDVVPTGANIAIYAVLAVLAMAAAAVVVLRKKVNG